MTATFEAIGMAHLTPPQRREFANQLLADADSPAPPISAAKRAYIQRLQAEAKANPNDRVSWDDIYAQLLKEFPE